MPWQIDSPRPVPTPTGLVVKNGSKMRATILGRDAARRCRATSTTTRLAVVGARGDADLVVARRAPSGIACAALTSRFRNTWPRRDSLASTSGTSP